MLSVESKLRAKVLHSHLHEFISKEYKFMKREASSGTVINLRTVLKRLVKRSFLFVNSMRILNLVLHLHLQYPTN